MSPSPSDQLERALRGFAAEKFARRHGGHKESLSPMSHEYLLTCPCGSSRLRWNVAKNAWVCWGHPTVQGRSGTTLSLICLLEGVEEFDAIGIVLEGYIGGDAKIEKLSGGLKPHIRRQEVRRLPPIGWPQGVDRLTEPCAPHAAAWKYLEGRGLTQAQVRDYQLGFGRSGWLEGRIVFPAFMDHAMVFWQARTILDPPRHFTDDQRRVWITLYGYRKTLNPIVSGQNATGSEVVFNLDRASTYETIVVCEGPVDAIKTGPNAVALLGKVAQPIKVQRLRRTSARAYIVYLDRGEEERKNAVALARELSPYAPVWIAEPPEGHDPGSLTLEQNADILRRAVYYEPGRLG